MIRIHVSTSKKYDVIMEKGALSQAADLMANAGITGVKNICIVTDRTVAGLYGGSSGALRQSLERAGFHVYQYVFDGGEKSKTMGTVAGILNFLADNRFSRSDMLIALGGGITGDVTGFAAATYMRGIDYVQVPTTLLATVDSSVGGKTGVNLDAGKNLAGAFWQPSLVIFDPDVLSTLPRDIVLDGIAEAVKAGFIADDSIIEMLESRGAVGVSGDDANCNAGSDATGAVGVSGGDAAFLTELAAKAVEVKRAVVEEDERESGSRQLLNFGHTPAHAIEKCSDYRISHGHAVAMGMVMVSAAAAAMGWSSEDCSGKIIAILKGAGFPLDCPYDARELADAALRDKKVRGDDITLIVPDVPGRCFLKTIPTGELEQFFRLGLKALKGADI